MLPVRDCNERDGFRRPSAEEKDRATTSSHALRRILRFSCSYVKVARDSATLVVPKLSRRLRKKKGMIHYYKARECASPPSRGSVSSCLMHQLIIGSAQLDNRVRRSFLESARQ